AWGDDRDRLRSALAVVLPAVRAWLDDPRSRLELGPADTALEELLPALRAGFARARDALAAAKRRAGVVDFSDVEVAALRALGDPAVVDHYRARWSALLVDEVQDTSPVQEAILAALAGFCRTTVVGDAKQSVYGFRGADPAVFHRMTERVQRAGGEAVVLDRSFRTHGRLVQAANLAFEAVLGGDHEPLTAHDPDPPTDDPPLRHWAVDAVRGVPSGARRRAEARRIAEEVRARLEAGTPVRDPDAPGGRRPLRAGDVAVLARSWAPLDLLAELLPAYGVPAVHTGGGDLLGTREAQDAICALRAVADEDDDVALVALLRGPMFAVSDVDLERYAGRSIRPDGAGSKPARWWPALQSERPAWAQRALDVLEEVREAAAHEPPSRLLQRLDRATGWSAVVANLPGGSRRLTDLEGVVDLVRELERGSGDVFGVVRRLRRLQRAGAKVERPALEAGDAVTLTTIHRSKGLEWPWVVVAALDAGTRGRPPALRMDPELGVAVRVEAGDERRAAPALWTLLEMQDVAAEEAEDRRLLYVALTRAADAATVSAAAGSGRYLDLLAPGLERAGVTVEARPFDPADARWPSPPLPSGQRDTEPARDRLDAGVANRAEAEDVRGSAIDRSGAGDRSHGRAQDATAWDLAQAWVEAIAPEVGGLVADLRAAGVPAPRTEPASEAGGASVLLRWETDAGPVHLLEPGTEDDGVDAAPRPGLAVDPDDPETARRRLLRALRGDAG
ncbi:MAG: UvrD-helicase domain-containing protein, partial [Deinococcus-Thermus bacterium]|nr:UvrD-helicase domain-containing protein [Deinococcota bacterium]